MTVITHKQLHASIPSMGSFLDLRAGVSQTDATLIYSFHLCFFMDKPVMIDFLGKNSCRNRLFICKIVVLVNFEG